MYIYIYLYSSESYEQRHRFVLSNPFNVLNPSGGNVEVLKEYVIRLQSVSQNLVLIYILFAYKTKYF